jgi:hypothetical protein
MTTSWTKPSPHRRVFLVALRRMLLPLAVGGALACHHFVDPPLRAGAEAFKAPAEYELWWQLTQACGPVVTPATPGNALFGGHFALTVLARNPSQHFVAAGQPWALWPGTHRVNGGYGGQWSPPMTLEISP